MEWGLYILTFVMKDFQTVLPLFLSTVIWLSCGNTSRPWRGRILSLPCAAVPGPQALLLIVGYTEALSFQLHSRHRDVLRCEKLYSVVLFDYTQEDREHLQ